MSKAELIEFIASIANIYQPPPAATLIPFLISSFVELTADKQEKFIRDHVEDNIVLEFEDEFRDADQILRVVLHAQGLIRLYISFSLTTLSALFLTFDNYLGFCGLLFSLFIGLLSWIIVRETDPNDWRSFEPPLIDRTAAVVIIYNLAVVGAASFYFTFLPSFSPTDFII